MRLDLNHMCYLLQFFHNIVTDYMHVKSKTGYMQNWDIKHVSLVAHLIHSMPKLAIMKVIFNTQYVENSLF